ncbi:hypothetical protein [Microbacterium gorillae]|uniref:hypothetical protein n=1 Tax=Microbacterium gorillae TaxID=1231063 RepID=UPI00058BB3BA|nr:hypothetical protein [Microbacterium gorillae]
MGSGPGSGLTPRVAGIGLMVLSVVGGIAAGVVMPDPRWSLIAAIVLTGATIGMAIGLLWSRRRSWAEDFWPPRIPTRTKGERMMRNMRVLAYLLVLVAPVLLGLAAWSLREARGEWSTSVLIVLVAVAYAGGGIGMLRDVRRAQQGMTPRPEDSRHPEDTRATAADGWRPLGPRAARSDAAAAMPLWTVLALLAVQLPTFLPKTGGPLPAPLFLGLLVFAAVIFIVLRLRAPQVEVHVERRRVRVRGREVGWDQVTTALLRSAPPWEGVPRTLVLVLGDDDRLRAPVVLRDHEALSLSEAETRILTDVIDASAIAIPRAKEDPRGKFSAQLFPTNLEKDTARAMVLHPPTMHDPVPTPT